MSPKEISIAFIGAGAIGSLFGGYLASLNSELYCLKVILFTKKSHYNIIKEHGLHLLKPESEILLENIEIYHDINDFKKKNSFVFDYIFITTKAYDINTVIIQYKKIIDECKYLVLLQNGLGNEDIALKTIESSKIIRAITTNGALVENIGKVIHTGIGLTKIGFPFKGKGVSKKILEDLHTLGNILNIAGLETIIVEDIISECWQKIFINIGINAIGALTRLRNGELLEDKGLKLLMAGAIKEALLVADKKNIILSKNDYINLTYEVAENTYQNKNSMLQDILKEKKTEIEFINGKIVDYAKELNIEVPINTTLTLLIKGLEK